MEWPLRDAGGETVWTDLVIEAPNGEILEVVECKEHEGHLPVESISKFIEDCRRLQGASSVSRATRFHFVSTARFLSNGSDMQIEKLRSRAFDGVGAALPLSWELGAESKRALSAFTVLRLTDHVRDAKSMYTYLYARFAAQMSHRAPGEGQFFFDTIRDLHIEVFREVEDRHFSRDVRVDPADAFEIDELRKNILPRRPRSVTIAKEKIDQALRRNLFGEKVSLAEIFIDPEASYEQPVADRTLLYPGNRALSALFDWLTDVRQRERGKGPLLVIGPFGSGKSSLLTMFAARLLEAQSDVLPLLVPLRELVALGPQKSFRDVLCAYVEREWQVDLMHPAFPSPAMRDVDTDAEVRYCLICDGFDELNLYYARSDQRAWVEQVFRELVDLSQYRHLAVAVSSRPILLMDLTRENSPGALSPRLMLHDFTPQQVSDWCNRYRVAAGVEAEFSAEFLADRNLLELCRTPIMLYMLAQIIDDEPSRLSQERYTQSDVFRIFVDWTASKGGYRRDELKHRVPPNYREILQDAAWHLSQTDAGFMEEDELLRCLRRTYGDVIGGISLDRNLLVAHMFQPLGGKLGSSESTRLVEFRHQAFRDYLVAERIWRILRAARNGESLRAADWGLLRGRPVTPATVQLLDEILQLASDDELRKLYDQTLRVDQVHTYWTVWAAPIWDELEREIEQSGAGNAAAVRSAKTQIHTLAPRVCAQVVLGFLVRLKAYRWLDERGKSDGLEPPSADALRQILAFLATFPETGLAGQAHTLLLSALDGLRLGPHGDLRRVDLSTAHLHDARFDHVDLTGAFLEAMSLGRTKFHGCFFNRAALVVREGDDLDLTGCSLDGAEVTLGRKDRALRNVDLSGAKFDDAIVQLHLVDSTLIGCSWSHTHFHEIRLERCTLDGEAWGVLMENGGHLIDCRLNTSKSWGSRRVFKDLAAELRTRGDRDFERAALPYLRIVYGDVRQSPPRGKLDRQGVDLFLSTARKNSFDVVVQCKTSVEREALPDHLARCKASIEAFRESGLRTRTYILLFNREVDTVTHRKVLLDDLRTLLDSSSASEVLLWNHHDLLNAAFTAMHGRVAVWLQEWNRERMEEHRAVEQTIGSAPLTAVPLAIRMLRVDAAHLLSEVPGFHIVQEPFPDLLDGKRKIRVLIGTAGMGKTTAVMRAIQKMRARWIFIPAAAVRGDVANAHALFEKALDEKAILHDASDEDRPVWQRMIGPVLKKLTQQDSGYGIIVDGLDESPALESSYGLQRFFTLFRRAVVPVIVTARTEFWNTRRGDFETEITGMPDRESTVQRIQVIELEPWGNEQIVEATEKHLAGLTDPRAIERAHRFAETVRSGEYQTFYGDLPRTPLFLRLILDLLEHEDPRALPRATVMLRWARMKVLRDHRAPISRGGRRLPIRADVQTADDTVELSFRSMAAAAAAMTEIEEHTLHLLPDCRFQDVRLRIGADAPSNVDALLLNSLLVPSAARAVDGTQRIRFAHRLFHELFLAIWIREHRDAYVGVRMPPEIADWMNAPGFV